MDQPQVKLTGIDGNVFVILGACKKAAKKAGKDDAWWKKFHDEATTGDYDHVLQTIMKYFQVA